MTDDHPDNTNRKPVSLWQVLGRLWDVLFRRRSLHDSAPYGWTWKDLYAGTRERDTNSSYLNRPNDADY